MILYTMKFRSELATALMTERATGLATTLAQGSSFGAIGPSIGALAAALAQGSSFGATGPSIGGVVAALGKGSSFGATGPSIGGVVAALGKGSSFGATGPSIGGVVAALGKGSSFGAIGPSIGALAAALAQGPSFGEVAAALGKGPSFGAIGPSIGALTAALAQGPSFGGLAEQFGAAWDERIEAAVGRLDRVEDIVADASEPERAVEDLVEDAATVQEAAPPEAKDEVDRRVWWFLLWLADRVRIDPALEGVRETVFQLIVVLLVGTGVLPVQPPAPATHPGAEAVSTALTLPGAWAVEGLPAIVERAGPTAAERVVEFFTAQIRNGNTRAAYAKAVTQFFTWCDERGLELDEISPVAVAAYVEELQGVYRAPTIKQHLAAIRRLFDWLVVGQVVPWNPTAAVRGPTHVVKRGKTPVLQPREVRLLLDSIDTSSIGGLRDRALMGVMIYSFARVSAVVNMDVDDYYQQGKRWWLRLREKGGKHHALPVHHKAEAYLDAYLAGAGIAGERGSPLWRSLTRTRELGERRMSRVDVFRMVKRRVKAAEFGEAANCHTFRASGITAYLLNGGTLERAQAIAGHESPRTTQLYDRTADDITVEDIERIRV